MKSKGRKTLASPAFIYAFDNLGPYKFADFCGQLLGARYKGYFSGAAGADGGVDGVIDPAIAPFIGEWNPESPSLLLNQPIQPRQTIIFQFKHEVTARIGQADTRSKLLGYFTCKKGKTCELHSKLVVQKHPALYVLVTNVEITSQFREKFIETCRTENPDIEHFLVIGLDDLEKWSNSNPEIGHLFLPTIFGPPRFQLKIRMHFAWRTEKGYIDVPNTYPNRVLMLGVSVLNVGTVSSYIERIEFQAAAERGSPSFSASNIDESINPKPNTEILPGRKLKFYYGFEGIGDNLCILQQASGKIYPVELQVFDEIENMYVEPFPEELASRMIEYMNASKHNSWRKEQQT
jgi:hypothetical protein